MNTPQEQQRSCFNCRNEAQGYCRWALAIGDFCPPWVSDGKVIVSDMGAICNVWELREDVWEK